MINIQEEKTNQTDQIEFHLRDQESDVFPTEIPQGVHWTHDVTGEIFKFWSKVNLKYPQHAMMWVEGQYGGYKFQSNKNTIFETESGVRGIGYKAIVAFDSEGNGLLFMK